MNVINSKVVWVVESGLKNPDGGIGCSCVRTEAEYPTRETAAAAVEEFYLVESDENIEYWVNSFSTVLNEW